MKSRRIAYVRTSPADGPDDLVQLAWAGEDVTFKEQRGPKDHRRPQRAAAVSSLKPGDTLVVQSMERLARSMEDLEGILRKVLERGGAVEFVTEGLTFSPGDPLYLDREVALIAAGSRFVTAGHAERQREGIKKPRPAKRMATGRKLKLGPDQLALLLQRFRGLDSRPLDSIAKIAHDFGISRDTVYRYVRAGPALVHAAKLTKRAVGQERRGSPDKAAKTRRHGVAQRMAAFKSSQEKSLAEARLELDEAEAMRRARERLTTYGVQPGSVVKESGDE